MLNITVLNCCLSSEQSIEEYHNQLITNFLLNSVLFFGDVLRFLTSCVEDYLLIFTSLNAHHGNDFRFHTHVWGFRTLYGRVLHLLKPLPSSSFEFFGSKFWMSDETLGRWAFSPSSSIESCRLEHLDVVRRECGGECVGEWVRWYDWCFVVSSSLCKLLTNSINSSF